MLMDKSAKYYCRSKEKQTTFGWFIFSTNPTTTL